MQTPMRISRLGTEFWAGALFFFLGVATVAISRGYPAGNATELGPGAYPMLLGGLLIVCGAWMGGAAVFRQPVSAAPRPEMRAVLAIAASALCFAWTAEPLGLPIATFIACLIACAARRDFLRPSTFVLAAALSAVCVVVFVEVLGIPIRVYPAGIGGS